MKEMILSYFGKEWRNDFNLEVLKRGKEYKLTVYRKYGSIYTALCNGFSNSLEIIEEERKSDIQTTTVYYLKVK